MCAESGLQRLRHQLLTWGEENTRDYPWRQTYEPYAILVAEFMLHRTQVAQVVPVYHKFMQLYPNLDAFRSADRSAVQSLLYSLGLEWRIIGMQKALEHIAKEYGDVPTDEEQLRAIAGIGPYISGAVRCFALNLPLPLVDTNTVRVTGRIFGLELRGEARRRPATVEKIGTACDPDRPRAYYFAMIDLAHTVCTPVKPDCRNCPLQNLPCEYFRILERSHDNIN